jgi:DNA polymerase elongation subunit (family B)
MPKLLNAITHHDRIDFVYRDDAGKLMLKRAPAEYCSFHRLKEIKPYISELKRTRSVTGMVEDGEWLKLRWSSYEARKHACAQEGPLAEHGVKCFEADVSPMRRWLTDHHAEVGHPRFAYLDIETDSRVPFSEKEQARILCWTLIDSQDESVIYSGLLEHDTDEDERRILNELWDACEGYDLLVAWMSPFQGEFDFEMIRARTKAVQANDRHVRRLLYLDHLKVFKRMNSTSAESGEEKRSYKLDAIAQALKVGQKDRFDASKTWEAWCRPDCSQECMRCRGCLYRYNRQDTALMKRIEDKTGFIALFQTLCDVCCIFPESHSLHPTVQMDGFMLQLGRDRQHHFPTKYYEGKEDDDAGKYEGAFVVEPRKGIQRNIHVGDFKSMYPNNIITWNMSPETKVSGPPSGPVPDGMCRCPSTGVLFRTDRQGILAAAVAEMLRLREWWNEERTRRTPNTPEWKDADRRATAYKVAANSFYGVVGSPYSRYYDRQVAESITQNGVWLIKKTIEEVTKRGWTTEYGDTDAVYVKGCSQQEFEEFTRWLNAEFYPRIIGATGAKSVCKMAYEKEFDLVVFAGKKRYCGKLRHYKGKLATEDSEPTIAGFEYKRGDVTRMAAAMQKECIDLLCKKLCVEPALYEPILNRYLDHLLNDPLELDEVKLSKSLSHNLSEYAVKLKADGEPAAQSPHVMLAHELLKRGVVNTRRIRGQLDVPAFTRIEYVVQDAKAAPMRVLWAPEYTGECDRFYYWEKMVWPATRRLLDASFPQHDWTKYDRVRPRKLRSGARVPEGQWALPFGDAPQTGLRNTVLPFDVGSAHVTVHTSVGTGAPAVPAQRRTRGSLASTPVVIPLVAAQHPHARNAIERVHGVLRRFPGQRPVELHITVNQRVVVLAINTFRVAGTPELLAAVREAFG